MKNTDTWNENVIGAISTRLKSYLRVDSVFEELPSIRYIDSVIHRNKARSSHFNDRDFVVGKMTRDL